MHDAAGLYEKSGYPELAEVVALLVPLMPEPPIVTYFEDKEHINVTFTGGGVGEYAGTNVHLDVRMMPATDSQPATWAIVLDAYLPGGGPMPPKRSWYAHVLEEVDWALGDIVSHWDAAVGYVEVENPWDF